MIDLNGFCIANTGRDFLSVAANATVNVTNCVLTGLCPFYSGAYGTLNVYGGHFKANPASVSPSARAEGVRAVHVPASHRGESFAYEVMSAEKRKAMSFEAELNQVLYANLNVALSVTAHGATVCLVTNVGHSVSRTDNASKTTTLDLGG